MDGLHRERGSLHMAEEERAKMLAFGSRQQARLSGDYQVARDVVEFNVGGEVMAAKRGTLTMAEGTLLEAIFSGRWEESLDRDAQGRVFLDFSPTAFRALLSHLRVRRDAKPGQAIKKPAVPPEFREEFESMVGFLEISEFISVRNAPIYAAPEALECVKGCDGDGTVSINEGCVSRSGGRTGTYQSVVGASELLDPGSAGGGAGAPGTALPGAPPTTGEDPEARTTRLSSAWKICIKQLGSVEFFAGIIAEAAPAAESWSSSSSYGWGFYHQVYAGKQAAHWQPWQQGDVAVFQLDAAAAQLRMYRRGSATRTLQLPGPDVARNMRLHLNFHEGSTQVEVAPATREDLQEAAFAF